MATQEQQIKAVEAEHLLQVYKRIPIVFARGEGSYLFDTDDRPYLDFVSGLGVASLGHANPDLAEAVADQARTLVHTSNLYFHPLQGEVGRRLTTLSGLARAFFCNSGTEAVEGCLKFARRYWHTRGEPRTRFVALERSFHGRTLGSLSTTWEPGYRAPFEPLLDVTFVSPTDPAALATACGPDVAAIIVEPIQGEGGVWPLAPAFTDAVTEACRTSGALLIADEIQCGLGRTGAPFYSATLGLQPDLMSLGKALGAGVPIGAILLSQRVADAISPGDHGTTYGGNLLACRAALVFLEAMEDGGFERVRQAGVTLGRGLDALAQRYPVITDIRGAGLMRGLEMPADTAAQVVEGALARRLLVNRTAGDVVRMLPPLTVSDAEIDKAVGMLAEVLDTLQSGESDV
ncbi:MAG TPA: aspartate aminotransferase family protein [Acidobacteria bacterium]|jgi:acetylornithine aminotransferase/acetylornithine/N-succinyldiaminopimelate aminotransferase|nr:aspartate aminotransferase family protein [Acidobacteriota bacterium]